MTKEPDPRVAELLRAWAAVRRAWPEMSDDAAARMDSAAVAFIVERLAHADGAR